jgi:hypothetical protein
MREIFVGEGEISGLSSLLLTPSDTLWAIKYFSSPPPPQQPFPLIQTTDTDSNYRKYRRDRDRERLLNV